MICRTSSIWYLDSTYAWVCFWAPTSVPWFYFSFLVPLPCSLDYYRFTLSLCVCQDKSLFPFYLNTVFVILGLLLSDMNFRTCINKLTFHTNWVLGKLCRLSCWKWSPGHERAILLNTHNDHLGLKYWKPCQFWALHNMCCLWTKCQAAHWVSLWIEGQSGRAPKKYSNNKKMSPKLCQGWETTGKYISCERLKGVLLNHPRWDDFAA